MFQQDSKIVAKFGNDFKIDRLYAFKNIVVNDKITLKGYSEKKHEKEKVLTLFKIPPHVEDKEKIKYLSKYGSIA